MAPLPPLTLDQAVTRYLMLREKRSAPSTVIGDRSTLRRAAQFLGDKPLRKLTPSDIEHLFYDDRTPYRNVSARSWNVTRARVSAFCTYLERQGYIKQQSGLMSLVDAKRAIRRNRFRLTPRQLLALPGMAERPRDRALLATAVHTALRRSNLLALRLGDIDLDSGRVHAFVTKSQVEDLKPITAELDLELRAWLTCYTQAMGPLDPSWFLFPGRDHHGAIELVPNRPMSVKSSYRLITPLLQGLGGGGQDGWHTLRRSTAMAYFDSKRGQGYDHALLSTSVFLNHADVATTIIYLDLSHERQLLDETMLGKGWLSDMIDDDRVVSLDRGRSHSAGV